MFYKASYIILLKCPNMYPVNRELSHCVHHTPGFIIEGNPLCCCQFTGEFFWRGRDFGGFWFYLHYLTFTFNLVTRSHQVYIEKLAKGDLGHWVKTTSSGTLLSFGIWGNPTRELAQLREVLNKNYTMTFFIFTRYFTRNQLSLTVSHIMI